MTDAAIRQAPAAVALADPVPSALVAQLWARVADRLSRGDSLTSTEDFQQAILREYESLSGAEPDQRTRRWLCRMVARVNARHPETYLARGLQNGVTRAFEQGVRVLSWDEPKVQSRGARSIRRFTRRDRVRDLLEEVNVAPDQIDVTSCVKESLQHLRAEWHDRTAASRPALPRAASEPVAPAARPASAVEQALQEPDVQAAIVTGEVDQREAEKRLQGLDKRHGELIQVELAKVDQRLEHYVAEGKLTEDEADKVRQLRDVDRRLAEGEIDETEATQIRNSILGGRARDALERKVRDVVEQSVRYLQVFEAMQKIGKDSDDAVRFLIEHKEGIVAEAPGSRQAAAAMQVLADDEPLLQQVLKIVDRSDHEIRMMSVRLPPYNYIMSRGMERIGNMTIETEFVDDLRSLRPDDISERLSSEDQRVRVRPAADMRCLLSLVDHATKRTPFRKEIRLLRLSQSIEEFYRNTSDISEARRQAESFLKRRLRKIFPDMPTEEAVEIRQRSAEIIEAIEQRILEERRAAVEAHRAEAEAVVGRQSQADAGAEDGGEMELTDEERALGVQIGRVEIRVAGSYRRVPYKLMPDPDDPSRHVIAKRDEETGEVKPQLRRGSKRYVVKDRDGVWKPE